MTKIRHLFMVILGALLYSSYSFVLCTSKHLDKLGAIIQ